VINEYYNITAANFTPSDPVFDLPAGISCINTSIAEPLDAVRFHAPHLLPEVIMAAYSRGLLL
jgi:hypothetical protein